MKKHLIVNVVAALFLLGGAGTSAFADEGKDEARGKERSYFHQHGYDNLGIPAGQLPSPGECRLWYPDRPAGQQPPPGKCRRLRSRVPAGAWLIYRPKADPGRVDVSVYDEGHPDAVVRGRFDAGTGAFIREIRPR